MEDRKSKEVWEKPEMTIFGTLEELTGPYIKQVGASDGANWQGIPVRWES